MNLSNKTIVISGGSRGIGLAIALRENGVTDFDGYANDPSTPLFLDLLVDEPDGHYFRGG